MCVFIALPCTFLLPSKDFLSSAELLQELLGLLFLLFLIPHTLTEATPPRPSVFVFFKILAVSLCSNFTLCRKLYSLLEM